VHHVGSFVWLFNPVYNKSCSVLQSVVLAVCICGCIYSPLLMLLVCWSCFSAYSYMVCIDLAGLYWPN